MQHQYEDGCPCDRKGTSPNPCPGRLCRYRTNIHWYLHRLDYEQADFLFQRIAQDHAERMVDYKPKAPMPGNHRSRWE